MNKKLVLLTASADLCAPILNEKTNRSTSFLHLPLEEYEPFVDSEEADIIKEKTDDFSYVIYGNLRNAKYFVEWIKEENLLKSFQQAVHLVLDQPTADFLESNSIPAIKPREQGKPIDILEFMLRISRDGKTLYPTAENKTEEMPGLLQELEMEVAEFRVCREKTLDSSTLKKYQSEVDSDNLQAILFHNRSSITRTRAAFPGLNIYKNKVISGSAGVTKALIDIGIEPDAEAEGTWHSIYQVIEERL